MCLKLQVCGDALQHNKQMDPVVVIQHLGPAEFLELEHGSGGDALPVFGCQPCPLVICA